MKKSRSGQAFLFLAFLVAGFVVVVVALSMLTHTDEDSGDWTEMVGTGNKVGVIQLEGTLMSSDPVMKQLRKFRKKSSIKAIVLRINSPGGAVAPAQEIYREIEKVKKKKPVVASMETVGASAAYYIASNADRIVCSQGTITGSIGVIMMLPQIQKIIERIGIDVNVIKAGKYKDIGSAVRPLTEDERKILESFAAQIHEQFISDVAAGRKGKIERDKLVSIADGSFFTGEKAKELGLVDSIGNFYDAVKIAAELGGIKGEAELVYPKKKWDSWLDLVLESSTRSLGRLIERSKLEPVSPVVQ
jgi:protease IV